MNSKTTFSGNGEGGGGGGEGVTGEQLMRSTALHQRK